MATVQVLILRPLICMLITGAFLAPGGAMGHGAEFLSAKLTLLPDAEVLLEVTADYGSNPLIADESTAREALLDPVRVRGNEALTPLSDLAAASLTQHQNWAEYAPASYLPSDTETQPHTLITAAWRWQSETPEIVFEMPKGKLHDVLLWTKDANRPDAAPKWMLLLAGDRSKAISVHQRSWWRGWQPVGLGALTAVLGLLVVKRCRLYARTSQPADGKSF